ncbi:DinB family protein [Cellulomonas xiejunii]|uniref:DinB family protein n=1 Tax=Cellulomonas xiejunii TaxID=2968083 RepID=A0ABY5KS88_9CELL|nr:DinB family protein [Cellulomonas xiejunii]MCC2322568.1 DinB family protein [Cellulomonas xiejunii]UUI72603.1 DinB family protein [Cellulomonas xiejunii]
MHWGALLVDQLDFYWAASLWPRVRGLTDDEYLWEPVAGCWSVRPRADGTWQADGLGVPEPDPPPVTTIAWRLAHIAVDTLGTRARAFFGDDVPADADMFDPRLRPASLPATADDALEVLDAAYRTWRDGLAALDDEALAHPMGPRGAGYADQPLAALALHLHREVMHHGGEVGVLRDLYRAGFRAG